MEYPKINITEIASLISNDKGIEKTENEIKHFLQSNKEYIRTPFPEFQVKYTIEGQKITADVMDWDEDDELGVIIAANIRHSQGFYFNYIIDEEIKYEVLDIVNDEFVETTGEMAKIAYYYALPIIYSIILMHCKNVIIKDAPLQKIKGKFKEPKETYKILEIQGFRTLTKYLSNKDISETGIKKALHICRGHLRTYSETKPLFGKLYGTYFIPAHTRGSGKYGKVKKDYKILTT